MTRLLSTLATLVIATVLHAADELRKPDVPDPFGLGERLALLDYLKTELHATVAEGATYEELVKQYWDIVDQPKREAEAAQRAEIERLRARLKNEFKIESDESDPAKLKALIAEAEQKAVLRIDGSGEVRNDAKAPPTPAPEGALAEHAPAPASTSPAEAATTVMTAYTVVPIAVPGGTDLEMTIPARWELTRMPADSKEEVTLRIASSAHTVTIQLTCVADRTGRSPSAQWLDDLVNRNAAAMVEKSVEKAVTMRTLEIAHGLGRYAEFTEAKEAPPPGALPSLNPDTRMAVGAIQVGTTVVGFSLAGRMTQQELDLAKVQLGTLAPRGTAGK